jgi:hypothetical protein
LCELDPVYCDRILQRWEQFAKDDAELINRQETTAGTPVRRKAEVDIDAK